MTPKISVIIVSWNIAPHLKQCLHSVFATKYPDLEVFVVDNASSDDSVKVAHSFKHLLVLHNVQNIGFPRAVNQGLRLATGEYMLILNPDTTLPPDFFTASLQFYSDFPQTWLMGPKFLNPDGSIQGSVFPNSYQKVAPVTATPLPVKAVSGGCLLFPKSTLAKVGLLTEKVFMYYEDLDYCRRIRALGGQVYYNPTISIVHHHGQSSAQNPQSQQYLSQSSLWYHGPIKYYLLTFYLWLTQKLRAITGARFSR